MLLYLLYAIKLFGKTIGSVVVKHERINFNLYKTERHQFLGSLSMVILVPDPPARRDQSHLEPRDIVSVERQGFAGRRKGSPPP
jgi:hypothetical protein